MVAGAVALLPSNEDEDEPLVDEVRARLREDIGRECRWRAAWWDEPIVSHARMQLVAVL